MSRFPLITPINSKIVNAITNTNKVSFSGTKVFAYLSWFLGDGNYGSGNGGYIGNDTYYSFDIVSNYNNKNNRIPAIIKSIDVKTAGNMGAIKKAEVIVQFSSMQHLLENKGILIIGKSQLLVWGWTKKRNGSAQNISIGSRGDAITLGQTAFNAKKHKAKVTGEDYDIHCGILSNFNIKVNADLTTDVTLELTMPSDIPAFLAIEDKYKTSGLEGEKDGADTALAALAARLDPNKQGTAEVDNLRQHCINLDVGFWDDFLGQAVSEEPYINFGYIVNQICNKGKDLKAGGTYNIKLDLSKAVAGGRSVMISASENVIIPAKNLAGVNVGLSSTDSTTVFTLENNNPVSFGPITLGSGQYEFPESVGGQLYSDDPKSTYNAFEIGYIKNLFVKVSFISECLKGATNVKEFINRILSEFNIASAGLWDLALRDLEDDNGYEVFSIVDYNFNQDLNKFSTVLESLNIVSPNSTITNIDLQSDLPKELAAQAMLGIGNNEDRQNGNNNEAKGLFGESVINSVDPIIGAITDNKKNAGNQVQVPKPNPNYNYKNPTLKQMQGNVNPTFGQPSTTTNTQSTTTPNQSTRQKVYAPGQFGGLTFEEVASARLELFGVKTDLVVFFKNKGLFNSTEDILKVVIKDPGQIRNLYFNKDKIKQMNSLLPMNITITTLGIGGLGIGEAVKIPYLPWLDNAGYWQVTDITHKISNNNWETDIQFRFRVSLQN